MKPINLRTGFATNSSSSHSIIYSADPSKFPDCYELGHNEFGWQWFLQKSRKEKLRYIVQSLENWNTEKIAEYLDIDVSEVEDVWSNTGYIDHDSVGMIPHELMKTVLNDDSFAILGGNDNTDPPDWTNVFDEIDVSDIKEAKNAYSESVENNERVIRVSNRSFLIAEPQAVTTFNFFTGEKIRYNPTGENPEVYLSVPELVDIKITDFCPYGCDYCYQDSTVDGIHGDTTAIFSMIDYMKDLGVFELAIGGGEPTLHPDFDGIIERCINTNDKGMFIVPNFTTRNLSIFKKDIDYVANLLNSIGGFAYSVDEPNDVERYKNLIDYWFDAFNRPFKEFRLNPRIGYETNAKIISDITRIIEGLFSKVSFQVVLGGMNREQYKELVESVENLIRHFNQRLQQASNEWNNVRDLIIIYARRNNLKPHFIVVIPPYFFDDEDKSLLPSIMLLGYKTTGRGSEPEYDYSENGIKDLLSSSPMFNIGIDTAAAQQMKNQIEELGIPPESYYIKEGVASCYIDAVSMKMAASSYNNAVANGTMDDYVQESFVETFNLYQQSALKAISIKML